MITNFQLKAGKELCYILMMKIGGLMFIPTFMVYLFVGIAVAVAILAAVGGFMFGTKIAEWKLRK